jgi:sodium/bile acid cotransporter 7
LRREDVVAAAFAGSQKTLPIGLLVATELAGKGVPFVVFPILMYHASQLILDTMIADWFHRWLARHEGEEPPAGS